jgi:hypothetical protein
LACLCLCISGCGYQNSGNRKKDERNIILHSGKLIPIDLNDSNFSDLESFASTLRTPKGWNINYYVKDDSTKYEDLYIEWSKENMKGEHLCKNVQQYRRYFIPEYKGENDKFLFLTHGCATDCNAVLTLSKESLIAKDFENVVDFDIANNQIVSVSDYAVKKEPLFGLTVYDLKKGNQYDVKFKNLCMTAANKGSCVDTIIFNKSKVTIKANLALNDYYRENEIVETKTVFMK